MNTQNAFARMLLAYQKVYDLQPLFEDFLDLCLVVLSPSALAGFPLDRDRFDSILLKYSDPAMPIDLTSLFAALLREVRCRQNPPHQVYCYSDVVGDFYEENILGYDATNPFASWDMDEAKRRPDLITIHDGPPMKKRKLFDPLCASGRRLLTRRWMHTIGTFYGAEVTPVCAKMCILNLFLHHVPNAEVICVQATDFGSRFLEGYSFSYVSPGIKKIEQSGDSNVWDLAHKRIYFTQAV